MHPLDDGVVGGLDDVIFDLGRAGAFEERLVDERGSLGVVIWVAWKLRSVDDRILD